VLRAFERIRTLARNPLLILAPRKPEHFAEAASLARQSGFRTALRSELAIDAEVKADVVVLDTIGELAQVYQAATVVFVGGSLVPIGGHNILEPAVYGKPIVFGPHMQNFAEIADAFLSGRAAIQVTSARELEDTLIRLLSDPDERLRLGDRARALVEANRGSRERSLAAIAALLPLAAPATGHVLAFPGTR
jgi:3-deoxy-D-manno-octulosonic-acid transferase